MLDNDSRFLNLIVQRIQPNSLIHFIKTWLKQECKDFRIIFNANNLDNSQKLELEKTIKFATELELDKFIEVIDQNKDHIPKAEVTKILKDTLSVPLDKFEVLRLKNKFIKDKNIKPKIKENGNSQIIKNDKNYLNSPNNSQSENTPKIIIKEVEKIVEKPIEKIVEKIIEKPIEKIVYIQERKPDNKIVCYTCITNDYDSILEPAVASPNIDFICFSDTKIQSKCWTYRPIPIELKNLDPIRQQRMLKICPHRFLKEYDISIWVDGNIQIKDDLNKFLKIYKTTYCTLWVRKHPKRDCIYAEAKECIAQKKAPAEIIEKQMAKYRATGYPEHNGLVETGIILRKHTDFMCQKVCDVWAAEILTESYRDQLSFNYACEQTKFKYGILIYDNDIINENSPRFHWNRFHANTRKKSSIKLDKTFITIAICNFNTTKMTTNCIKSIVNKSKLSNLKFLILDNSYPKNKFTIDNDIKDLNIQILDNTNGKYINFDDVLKKFSKIPIKANNNGSLKHCYSIQFLLNKCKSRDMLLFDSDTILKSAIDFINPSYVTIADLEIKRSKDPRMQNKIYTSQTRFMPFIQYFNCEKVLQCKLKYFYADRIHGGSSQSGNYYDTGASFYEDLINRNLPFKRIYYIKYIDHLDHGSWKPTK